jgi:hypothetical protein
MYILYIRTYTHTYIHAYIHTYIHKYIHTYSMKSDGVALLLLLLLLAVTALAEQVPETKEAHILKSPLYGDFE